MAESGEGQVDLGRLLESVSSGASFVLSLRTSQIDDVQLSHADVRLSILPKL